MRADLKVGRVRYAIRKSDFSGVLRKRRSYPPVQKFNSMSESVLSKTKLKLRITLFRHSVCCNTSEISPGC